MSPASSVRTNRCVRACDPRLGRTARRLRAGDGTRLRRAALQPCVSLRALLCVTAVIRRRLKADKHRVSPETSNTGEPYDATQRILLTDVPGWAGAQVSGRRPLPVPPRRVPPSAEQARDTVTRVVPPRAGPSTGPRVRHPREVASGQNAGAACTGEPTLIDAPGAATGAADVQRPSSGSGTGRWPWRRWSWRKDHGQRAPESDVGSVPTSDHEYAERAKPGGRHRHA
jgi:hypothetical protein